MYAIISLQGQQFKVEPGTVLNIDRLNCETGKTMEMKDCVLAAKDDNGFKSGNPVLSDAQVKVDVLEHFKGKKVSAFKMKRRQGYRRNLGHRQAMTKVKISDISL